MSVTLVRVLTGSGICPGTGNDGKLYVLGPIPRSMVLEDDEPPRRKRDPLKSFRDPRTERESRYKERLRIEAENRRRAWLERTKKKEMNEEED